MRDTTDSATVGFRLRGSRQDIPRAMEGFARLEDVELLPWPPHGGWPVPLARITSEALLLKYAEKGTRLERLEGAVGGDMTPHLHLNEDIFILERSDFKNLVADVAAKLSTDLAERVDYETTVDLMGQFAIDTVPLPE